MAERFMNARTLASTQEYIRIAMEDLGAKSIRGKEVTPYLLSRIGELSHGSSLDTNIRLLENNVKLACEIACSLSG